MRVVPERMGNFNSSVATSVCFFTNADQADVINRHTESHVLIYQFADVFANSNWRLYLTLLELLHDRVRAQLLVLLIHRFVDAVGVQDRNIARVQRRCKAFVLVIVQDPDRNPRLLRRYCFDCSVVATNDCLLYTSDAADE